MEQRERSEHNMAYKRQRGARGVSGRERVSRSQKRFQNARKSDLARIEQRDRAAQEQRDRDEQVAAMFTPKRGRVTLRAKYESVCPACWLTIEIDSICHVNADGLVVHDRHDRSESRPTVCPRCHLTQPCDC